jgi:outer membrane biosynthesis protein TonB
MLNKAESEGDTMISGSLFGFKRVLLLGLSFLLLVETQWALAPDAEAKSRNPKKQTLHSAPEVYSATTSDISEDETENLTMSDIADDENQKPKEHSEKSQKTVKTEPNEDEDLDSLDSLDSEQPVMKQTKISEIKKPVSSPDLLAERLSALEKELANFRSQANKPKPVEEIAVATPSSANKEKTVCSNSSGADIVPEQHKRAILKRIRIVEKLIEKYGLAYDYRTMTTQKLEETLARLDNESRQ